MPHLEAGFLITSAPVDCQTRFQSNQLLKNTVGRVLEPAEGGASVNRFMTLSPSFGVEGQPIRVKLIEYCFE